MKGSHALVRISIRICSFRFSNRSISAFASLFVTPILSDMTISSRRSLPRPILLFRTQRFRDRIDDRPIPSGCVVLHDEGYTKVWNVIILKRAPFLPACIGRVTSVVCQTSTIGRVVFDAGGRFVDARGQKPEYK